MGRRKERRLAAMHGAGRRVKLDLFAEPSGEAGDSSSHDGVGRNMDHNHHAGDPVSPSSSGQKQENPLMLLGQYSDEELDEEATEQPNNADEQTSLTGLDSKAEHGDANSNKGNINDKDVAELVDKESDKLDTTERKECYSVKEEEIISPAAIQNNETDLATHAPEASGPQILGDVSGGWKMVMDEQSNRYYYWNTFTGETSWETPSSLALASENISEHDVSLDEDKAKSLVHEHSSMQLNDAIVAYSNISSDNQNLNGVGAHLSYDATNYNPVATGIAYGEASILPNVSSFHQSHIYSEHLTSLVEVVHASSGEHKDMHMSNYIESTEAAAAAHSVTLLQYAESLLQRLNTLTRPGNHVTDHVLIMKEIEIRIADCKALSSYGSSLLPFWWHTEVQLKQLESIIAKEESSQLITSKSCNKQTEDKATVSSERLGTRYETVGKNEDTSAFVLTDNSLPSRYAAKDGQPEMSNVSGSKAAGAEQTLSGLTFQASRDEKEPGEIEAHQTVLPVEMVDKVDTSAIEDVDMDVEMEVDEEIPADQTAGAGRSMGEGPTLSEQQIQTSLSTTERTPPPPEEEWIPPPPPESEAIPPPPTEEPPISPIPPLFPETRLLHSYQEQFNTGYSVPTYDYYTPTVNEVGNNGYCAPVEGCHIAEQATPCYGPVAATAFPHLGGDVSSVEPVVYYDPSSTIIPAGPVASSAESSIYYAEASSIGYQNHNNASLLDQSGKVMSITEPGSSALLPEKIDMKASQPASFTSTIQVAESSLVNGSNADAPPATANKNHTKVVRGKKRTLAVASSLRSNKKVSSLVNKWKAAKEELHGDEDEDEEPENAYEALERKRLKEIEEWRKRQIESGEAQDNANFLPLGGDWRERVRRKRGQKTKAAQTPSEAVEDEKKIPNLTELSKDLPSGWQAYWDESTKEVYYGNTVTSETSWTKPSR